MNETNEKDDILSKRIDKAMGQIGSRMIEEIINICQENRLKLKTQCGNKKIILGFDSSRRNEQNVTLMDESKGTKLPSFGLQQANSTSSRKKSWINPSNHSFWDVRKMKLSNRVKEIDERLSHMETLKVQNSIDYSSKEQIISTIPNEYHIGRTIDVQSVNTQNNILKKTIKLSPKISMKN